MVSRAVTVLNENGIHCRPSAVIIKACQEYEGNLLIISGSTRCDPRSILGLMSMGLQKGSLVTVEVDGPGEEEMLKKMADLLEYHFDFPPKEAEPSK